MVMSSPSGMLDPFVNIAQIVLGRSKAVMFVVLVLGAFGVRSYVIASQSIFPAMSFARIDVVADAGELTPERVRTAISHPLQTAFGTLPSATRVRATSSQVSAELLIDFDPATDPRVDLQNVEASISSLAPLLPAAKRVEAVIVNANSEPVVSYGLGSRTLSQAALNAYVTTRIMPAFADARSVQRGDAVTVSTLRPGQSARGRVRSVVRSVDPMTQTATVVVTGVPARAVDGDAVDATIDVGQRFRVVIPTSAIVEDPGSDKLLVFVRGAVAGEREKFIPRLITIETGENQHTLVRTGVRAGERVAARGAFDLLAPSGPG
jgi:hypothetical protein